METLRSEKWLECYGDSEWITNGVLGFETDMCDAAISSESYIHGSAR